jgi:16S rRNA (guanine966-N2)-methyltransferase
MRIISGTFKGKKLFLPKDEITRPLKDLVKESIFNLIQHSNKINIDIKDSLILDLFSGSGSFGIECLSREAKKVIFLENYSKAINILEKNLKSLKNINNFEIIEKNCYDFFKSNQNINLKLDIIFMDPPYKELKINEIIEQIKERNLLNKNGVIIIHRHKKDTLKLTRKINIIEERFYGISKISYVT